MSCQSTTLVIAGALEAALSLGAASAAENEKCFGVSLAGQNDCAADEGTSSAATPKTDYLGDAVKLVPIGTCTMMDLPAAADGTARAGSLDALKRDPPAA